MQLMEAQNYLMTIKGVISKPISHCHDCLPDENEPVKQKLQNYSFETCAYKLK